LVRARARLKKNLRPELQTKYSKKIPIDWNKVDKLAIAGCTGVEIAANIGCHPDTLYERCIAENGTTFTEYSYAQKSHGDSLLRSKQLYKALNKEGDNTMLVWLGKNRLAQRDDPKSTEIFDGKLAQVLDLLMKIKPDLFEKKVDGSAEK